MIQSFIVFWDFMFCNFDISNVDKVAQRVAYISSVQWDGMAMVREFPSRLPGRCSSENAQLCYWWIKHGPSWSTNCWFGFEWWKNNSEIKWELFNSANTSFRWQHRVYSIPDRQLLNGGKFLRISLFSYFVLEEILGKLIYFHEDHLFLGDVVTIYFLSKTCIL